jgi:hypothetical protein
MRKHPSTDVYPTIYLGICRQRQVLARLTGYVEGRAQAFLDAAHRRCRNRAYVRSHLVVVDGFDVVAGNQPVMTSSGPSGTNAGRSFLGGVVVMSVIAVGD